MKPHKHAELIKAWADGAHIEFRTSFHIPGPGGGTCFTAWKSKSHDFWHAHIQYRIKPKPKPDVVSYLLSCEKLSFYYQWSEFTSEQLDASGNSIRPQIKIIWNGETGELKSAEVLE